MQFPFEAFIFPKKNYMFKFESLRNVGIDLSQSEFQGPSQS